MHLQTVTQPIISKEYSNMRNITLKRNLYNYIYI